MTTKLQALRRHGIHNRQVCTFIQSLSRNESQAPVWPLLSAAVNICPLIRARSSMMSQESHSCPKHTFWKHQSVLGTEGQLLHAGCFTSEVETVAPQ